MGCDDARQFAGGYLDDELDMAATLEFQRHLRECPGCAAEHRGRRRCATFCGLQT